MIQFEVGINSVDFLIEDQIVTVSAGLGPGFWARILDALKVLGHVVEPEELGNSVAFLYYTERPDLLVGHPEKMDRLGFFQCPKCGLVYSKMAFSHRDPCDNCRMKTGEVAVGVPG